MITTKYKNMYDKFIEKYEEIHINPWHNISKEECNQISNSLISKMNIDSEASFYYFMNYILKRLNGLTDAHTCFNIYSPLPISFKIFDEEIYVTYPDNLRKYKLKSINGISYNKIIEEIDYVISYGTEEYRRSLLEVHLSNKMKLIKLPSLIESKIIEYELIDENNNVIKSKFNLNEKYNIENQFIDNNCTFNIVDKNIVYTYNSCSEDYIDKIKESVEQLKRLDLNKYDKFILDLRNNGGGSSEIFDPVLDLVKKYKNLKIIVLTNYKIFSSARFVLKDFMEIGAITIGEGIRTPINCYGAPCKIRIEEYNFKICTKYFNFDNDLYLSSKEEFKNKVTNEIESNIGIFKPSILIKLTKDDYFNNIDRVLEYALSL